jgi:hypothetical protein
MPIERIAGQRRAHTDLGRCRATRSWRHVCGDELFFSISLLRLRVRLIVSQRDAATDGFRKHDFNLLALVDVRLVDAVSVPQSCSEMTTFCATSASLRVR